MSPTPTTCPDPVRPAFQKGFASASSELDVSPPCKTTFAAPLKTSEETSEELPSKTASSFTSTLRTNLRPPRRSHPDFADATFSNVTEIFSFETTLAVAGAASPARRSTFFKTNRAKSNPPPKRSGTSVTSTSTPSPQKSFGEATPTIEAPDADIAASTAASPTTTRRFLGTLAHAAPPRGLAASSIAR